MTDLRHHQINYIELPARDIDATKVFYGRIFGWKFQDWGPTYISFSGAGIDGGFDASDEVIVRNPGALIVLFSAELEATLEAVKAAGGTISKPIFDFPGGRRFHFQDPNGNELAVWAEPVAAD